MILFDWFEPQFLFNLNGRAVVSSTWLALDSDTLAAAVSQPTLVMLAHKPPQRYSLIGSPLEVEPHPTGPELVRGLQLVAQLFGNVQWYECAPSFTAVPPLGAVVCRLTEPPVALLMPMLLKHQGTA